MFYFPFDSYYFILVIPAILLSMWAQSKVQSTFSRYQRVHAASGLTGCDVARRILDENGLYDVRVERIAGSLTDHYDPGARWCAFQRASGEAVRSRLWGSPLTRRAMRCSMHSIMRP